MYILASIKLFSSIPGGWGRERIQSFDIEYINTTKIIYRLCG